MLTEKIQLWENRPETSLYAYLQNFNNKKRPAVIVCPGGGYVLPSEREAEPVAVKFAAAGYHAFVLRYSTYFGDGTIDFSAPPTVNSNTAYPAPLYDLAKAVITIRANADKWLVDKDKVAICGFSAGGHLAASLGVHWQDDFLSGQFAVEREILKPNALILCYALLDYELTYALTDHTKDKGGQTFRDFANMAVFGALDPDKSALRAASTPQYVSSNTPPAFLWHTADDDKVPVENSLGFAAALGKHQIPFELHVFERGVHASSLCDETTATLKSQINPHCQVWFDLAVKWLKINNFNLR